MTNNTHAAEIDLSNLSDRSIVVLAALVGAVHPDEIHDCPEYGFMDCAYAALDSDTFSKPSFAGHVGALGRFIDWKEGYFQYIKYNVTDEAWHARHFIAERAAAIKARVAK